MFSLQLIKGMNIKFLILLVLVLCSNCKLLSLFTMIRHGAIYPKNDLYDGNQTKPLHGKLTPVGHRQQYNLGSYFKHDYITLQNLTTPTFTPSHVEFFSSTYQRTQESAVSLIYGLYPLQEGWTIPENIPEDKLAPPFTEFLSNSLQTDEALPFALDNGFQPLPVRNLDDILDNCPNYDALMARRRVQVAAQVAIFESKHSLQIAKMKVLFNLTNAQTTLSVMSDLYQTLLADRYLGRPLPAQYNENDERNLRYMYEYYNTLIQDGNFARILATPSLRMLRQKLDAVLSNKTTNKMTFISAHSSNLWPLLTLFNLTSTECITQKWNGDPVTAINCVPPPYFAASLTVELHDDGVGSVMVRYNGKNVYLCENRLSKCEYSAFVGRIKNIEGNYQAECKSTNQGIMDIQEQ